MSSLYEVFNSTITYILIFVCFLGGLIFSFFFRAYNLNVKRIYKTLKGSNRKTKRGISGFQALMLSTASRIGNGNIAGVSSALIIGGPGALFWMWVTALLGMSTAFAEGTLSQLYKKKWGKDYVGGTPFYIAKNSGKRFLRIIAAIYALFAIFTFGSAYIGVQSNTIAANFSEVVGTSSFLGSWKTKLIMGFLLALIILAVTIKGVKSIGKFTSIVMPIMGSLYLLIALVIVVLNIEKTGQVYALIFNGAFGVKQIVGGIGGYTIIKAMQLGVRRGVFSNEAGIGSASFSAASSNSKHPIQQGLLQSLSTFLDTIIICSASAFIILYSGAWENEGPKYKIDSGLLIKDSIVSNFNFSPWSAKMAEWLVFISIFLFGMTTSVGLYFYSETALKYLIRESSIYWFIIGKKKINNGNNYKPGKSEKICTSILKILICSFVIYSSVQKVNFIWQMETVCTFILVMINVPFMLSQIKVVKNMINDYKEQVLSKKPITFEYDCEKTSISKQLIKKS